jgi:hypothetical protein
VWVKIYIQDRVLIFTLLIAEKNDDTNSQIAKSDKT